MSFRRIILLLFVLSPLLSCRNSGQGKNPYPQQTTGKRVLFLEIADPEGRISPEQLVRFNRFLSSLLGQGTGYRIIRLESGQITEPLEGCASSLPDKTLIALMDKNRADRIFFGDILETGRDSAILFLNSAEKSSGPLIIHPRQIPLILDDKGCWETGEPLRTDRPGRKTIMLDPGHGGIDTGAEAWFKGKKIKEVDSNNELSRLLGRELAARGYSVIYTRDPDTDVFITPKERSEIINRRDPDLLISIHHDFSERSSDSGFAVYWSSFKPVLESRDAYIMIDHEKRPYLSQTTIRGDSVVYFTNHYGTRTSTRNLPWWTNINPFVQDDTPPLAARESLRLGYLVYNQLKRSNYLKPYHYTPGKIIESRDYSLLRLAAVPSILIEAGFVTSPSDMTELSNVENRKLFILSVADGVDAFFEGIATNSP